MLHPEVAKLLDNIRKAKPIDFISAGAEAARAHYDKTAPLLDLQPETVHRVEDLTIPRPHSHRQPGKHWSDGKGRWPHDGIRVRIYRPSEPSWSQPQAAMLYLHGGGFTVGSLESHDALLRHWCNRCQITICAVDYRLAPDHPFPAAYEDAWAALAWLCAEAGSLGIDPKRIAIAGDSAGGTLSAACALAARDAELPLAAQILIYPGLGARGDTPSFRQFAEGYLLSKRQIDWFFDHYIPLSQRHDWRFAPLEAKNHRNLPPTWIGVAGCDPLHDEGVAYADVLKKQHVAVELHRYPGAVHGFFHFGRSLSIARQAHTDVAQFIQKTLC